MHTLYLANGKTLANLDTIANSNNWTSHSLEKQASKMSNSKQYTTM